MKILYFSILILSVILLIINTYQLIKKSYKIKNIIINILMSYILAIAIGVLTGLISKNSELGYQVTLLVFITISFLNIYLNQKFNNDYRRRYKYLAYLIFFIGVLIIYFIMKFSNWTIFQPIILLMIIILTIFITFLLIYPIYKLARENQRNLYVKNKNTDDDND